MKSAYQFEAIAYVESPYKEKFAIPRQPGIVSAAQGKIILNDHLRSAETVRGLSQFSHIWVLFAFHATQEQGWKPLVRPPRLGGNKKLGVLATRSTFRPNPIGMSVVKLDQVIVDKNHAELIISGLDLLDQTPVLDIKPYVPYSDIINDAQAGYAQHAPTQVFDVQFSDQANNMVSKHHHRYPELKLLISQVLSQDPRPAYRHQQVDEKIYGIRLYHFNIQWQLLTEGVIEVTQIDVLTRYC
ncbi:tRNA (N6-threonylcarbamoyladenosine(37)-N6)-methyltransferase TrmO [Thalassotalea ganghwensis]